MANLPGSRRNEMTQQQGLTPKDMVRKFTPNLSAMQRKANEDFFVRIVQLTKEGGSYVWPDEGKTFTVRGGLFYQN
jgi:hypothetical protein